MKDSRIARTAITLGVVGSLAGNVTWAWPRSWVLVGVGVLMALVLPVAVRLWRASAGVTGWARYERAAVMSFICGGAAVYTLIHSTLLLHGLGLPGVIAWLPAAVMEALVVMAARAGAPQQVTTTADQEPSRVEPEPVTRDEPEPLPVTQPKRQRSPAAKRQAAYRERQNEQKKKEREAAATVTPLALSSNGTPS